MKKLISEKTAITLILFGATILVFSIAVFSLWQNYDLNHPVDSNILGDLGSFVSGVIGVLWSLAGVILFYVALEHQRNDTKTNQDALKTQIEALKTQTKEFELQREELSLTRSVFEEQTETLSRQRFENTFFSLIQMYQNLTNSFQKNGNGKVYFKEIIHTLKENFQPDFGADLAWWSKGRISERYIKVLEEHHDNISPFLRIIFQIITFVDQSQLPSDIKHTYSKILTSQFSNSELLILCYSILIEKDEGAKRLFFKFQILQHLDPFDTVELYRYKHNGEGERPETHYPEPYIPVRIVVNEINNNRRMFFDQLSHVIQNQIIEYSYETTGKPWSFHYLEEEIDTFKLSVHFRAHMEPSRDSRKIYWGFLFPDKQWKHKMGESESGGIVNIEDYIKIIFAYNFYHKRHFIGGQTINIESVLEEIQRGGLPSLTYTYTIKIYNESARENFSRNLFN